VAHPREFIILGCWWLTREIEISRAKIQDVELTDTKADWTLSTSKSDPCALGTHRSHSCICRFGKRMAYICPVHVFQSHMFNLKEVCKQFTGDAPLFPNKEGGVCCKSAAIACLNKAGALLKIRITSHNGADSFGGHSLRRGGIVYLASAKVPRDKIKIIARQSSDAIDTYLAAVADVLAALAADTACDAANFLVKQSFAGDAPPKDAEECDTTSSAPSVTILNKVTDIWVFTMRLHAKVHRRNDVLPDFTLCGWHWAKCKVAICSPTFESLVAVGTLPAHCTRCATKLHALETDKADSSEGSSSESSSSSGSEAE
jgi:hypothetical protein